MEQMLHGRGGVLLVKMLQKCFAKVPQYWSSFLKKYIVFFVTLGGGVEGVRHIAM